MFASALLLENEPYTWGDLPSLFFSWLQDAGGFAAALMVVLAVAYLTRMRKIGQAFPPGVLVGVGAGALVSCLAYALFFVVRIPDLARAVSGEAAALKPYSLFEQILLAAGGAGAIFAVGLPFVVDAVKLRWRRIGAIARLSFKEAIRSKVLWAFSALLVLFLFRSWFVQHKPEQQLAGYVNAVFGATALLLLVVAGLVAAFGIPADIRSQSIHTVVTKPVERFEIVLGRFLGYTALMTLVLLATAAVSLLYVVRGVDPAAADESLKAREPLFGELEFENTKDRKKGENVGREWEYFTYISGPMPGQPNQYALWKFTEVPSGLGSRPTARCEFAFDIYRTTKGRDNKGIRCTFAFETSQFRREQRADYERDLRAALQRAGTAGGPTSAAEAADALAEKYGYYETTVDDIRDYHTYHIDVPGGLFRNAAAGEGARRQAAKAGGEPPAPLTVRVKCDSRTQYVGVAKRVLYFRVDDPAGSADRLRFSWNFLKGVAGIWLGLCLLIGMAVAFSTYLSGIISALLAGLLFLGGVFRDYVAELGLGTGALGDGPAKALYRIVQREVPAAQLEETTPVRLATGSDDVFRWFVRRLLNVLPDVDRFDLTLYVASGFNIPASELAIGLVMLAGYLLPCALLAYYLMKWREIATW